MSPFGSRTSVGIPARQRLLEEHDREPGLPRSRHPVDDAVGRQVARADDDLVGAGLARRRVDRVADVERAPVGHRRESRVVVVLESLRVGPGTGARIAERDPDDRLGLDKHVGEKRLVALVEQIDALQYRL